LKEISAGGVVYNIENGLIKILMIEDRCSKWTLPKGKNELGETYEETAIREILEETGIRGKIIKFLDKVKYEYYHPTINKIEKEVYFYLVEAYSDQIQVQLSEINSAYWLTLEEAWDKQKTYGYDNNLNVIKQALESFGFKIN